ncbi:MAG: acyl-CoA thioesterase, partial [Deltaproteobacteria bacterium]|nr:acyl-CoA thioesterase [Deltaproteobacteria bacterium]
GKTVGESSVIMAQQMNPLDANPAGNVHGGVIMKLIDTAGGAVAIRHARSNAVTASIDRLDFHYPVYIGDFLTLKASLNYVGKTSMEVGIRVESENLITGRKCHTASAYMTFVALDKDGRPMKLPPLILETDEERRRHEEAQARREMRLAEKTKEKGNHVKREAVRESSA